MHKVQETLPDSLPVFVSKFPKPKRLRKKKKEICGCGQQWPESMPCEPTANINNEAQKANTHSLSIPPPPQPPLRNRPRGSHCTTQQMAYYRPSVTEHDTQRPVKRHADRKAQTGIYQRVQHSWCPESNTSSAAICVKTKHPQRKRWSQAKQNSLAACNKCSFGEGAMIVLVMDIWR